MKIKVIESVLKDNDRIAQANREKMDQWGVRALNLVSAPGSGKTGMVSGRSAAEKWRTVVAQAKIIDDRRLRPVRATGSFGPSASKILKS